VLAAILLIWLIITYACHASNEAAFQERFGRSIDHTGVIIANLVAALALALILGNLDTALIVVVIFDLLYFCIKYGGKFGFMAASSNLAQSFIYILLIAGLSMLFGGGRKNRKK
jgi:Ca2+/H+ antiporter